MNVCASPQLVLQYFLKHGAVETGAVLCGCNPELISARRSCLSFGVRFSGPYTEGAGGKFDKSLVINH